MSDDPELEINETWSDDRTPKPRRRRVDSGNGKPLRIAVGVALILVFAGGIYYFVSKQSKGDQANPVEARLMSIEEKVVGLERQVADLQGKAAAPAVPDEALLRKVDALSQRIEGLEREKRAASEPKPSASLKTSEATKRQVHTVQKGETVQSIGKKYGISADQLRKLNNLPTNQPLRPGQKIVLSSGR